MTPHWTACERSRYAGGRFVQWAEPEPDYANTRFAVALDDSGRVRWWRFSLVDTSPMQESSGCFYADTGETQTDVIAKAAMGARAYKAKMARLLADG